MSALSDFHFLRPAWLLLLLALPLLHFFWRRARTDANAWLAAVDADLLPHLLERGAAASRGYGLLLAGVLWTLIALALAGPTWEHETLPLYRNQAARVLALELAPTMLSQDVKPSRLERARFKLDDILQRSRDLQTALIAYSGDAFVAAPLTDDVATVRNLVDSLDPSTMPVAGNATSRAIERARRLVKQAGLKQGELILLADSVGPGAVTAARNAREHGLTVSVLGVGSTSGAPVPLAQGGFLSDSSGNIVVPKLDEAALREVAEAGGGRYARMTADARDLDALLARAPSTGNVTRESKLASAKWRDRGPWLLLLILPLALLGFRRGWLMAIALMCFMSLPRAGAASLSDLWLRPDQQAAAALAQGDAKHAAAVAAAPAWRGSADFRAGDYAAAAENYAQTPGADALYNRGNALAKLGRYEDAIGAYSKALAMQPDMADAVANRKAVEEWLKRQPKSKPKAGQQNGSKSGNQDKSSSQKQQGAQQGGQKRQDQEQKQDGQQQGKQDQQSRQGNQTKPGDDNTPPNGKNAKNPQSDSGKQDDQSATPDASDAKASAAQKQALSKAMDQALAKAGKDKNGAKVKARAAREDSAAEEKRQALDQWLERVPDDPGGLLRRKFLLEYQLRQQNGEEGG
ncbi:MAG: VWA domain-containing protein [Rhodanobacteraceae bacterium]